MEYEERIKKDVDLLKKNLVEIGSLDFSAKEKEIIERAEHYQQDTLYYLKKKDFITSFGCITYAHGLIDSLRIIYDLI